MADQKKKCLTKEAVQVCCKVINEEKLPII